MPLPDITPGLWVLVADWLIRIAALFWIPMRTHSAAARTWLLLVGFVPLAGLPIYLLFGHPWLSAQRRQRQVQASQSIREQQRAFAALRWTPGDADDSGARDLARLTERVGDFMPTTGNRVALIDDYDAWLRALIDDIDAARHEVHLLYYLMFDDAVGRAVADALQRAAARGVRCRLLLDAMGGKPALRAFTRRLRSAGVDVRAILARGFGWRRSARLDLRNHRKIAVIDGRIGHVGSQNLAAPDFVAGFPNREVVARVEGPAVLQLAALFASDWYFETNEVLAMDTVHIDASAGTVRAQVLPSGPAYTFENARSIVIAAIQRARRRITLATPYFVPDEATLAALCIAALSGVEVQLILSRSSNQRVTAWAQASHYDELLRAGVRIALYRPRFLHAKHLTVDDDIALVGSINLDIRSFALNAEAGLLCYDRDVAARLREIEADYLMESDAVDATAWRARPAWRRSIEGIARLADSFL